MKRQWINKSQPQTLQYGVMLLYLNAAFSVISGLLGGISILAIITIGLAIAGGHGIANEFRWGYYVGVLAAILPLAILVALVLFYGIGVIATYGIVNLLFRVVTAAVLLAPASREYQKIWFR